MVSLKASVFGSLQFAAIISVIVCQQSSRRNSHNDAQFDAQIADELSGNVLQFAQNMANTILRDTNKKTEVFSPLSIYAVLSMILLGSNGQTYNELIRLLQLNNSVALSRNMWKMHEQFGILIDDLSRDQPNPLHHRPQDYWQTHRMPMWTTGPSNHWRNANEPSNQQITIANGIFVQNGFSIRPDYEDAVQSTYKSTLNTLDFIRNAKLSTNSINDWISKATNGKIPQMFATPLRTDTKVVIASALYFKAFWEKGFLDGATRQREFYPNGMDRPPITVEMMYFGGASPYYDSQEYNCSIIALPYRRNLTTMFIILPNNSNKERLIDLQAKLTTARIQEMISKMEWKQSIIGFPKMHIVNDLDLKEILGNMGLRSLFNAQESDLSVLAPGSSNINNVNIYNDNENERSEQPQRDEELFIFARLGEGQSVANETAGNRKNLTAPSRQRRSAVTYKASSSNFRSVREPLRLKDLVIEKRITKPYPRKKNVSRGRREAVFQFPENQSASSLQRLHHLRSQLIIRPEPNPGLFADDMKHKIDLTINEVGTEGGAATSTTMKRTGPEVVFRAETPFLFFVRHDDTKLPLFYGAVFEPTN